MTTIKIMVVSYENSAISYINDRNKIAKIHEDDSDKVLQC